ncbi:hypothetical protein ACFQE8_04050 [Salinirubellus sp. GCM10025818]|uniref:hypothetical protein n=1 Tax=Salinirubellus TaxID=2162630 RepID=UPI0030CD0074
MPTLKRRKDGGHYIHTAGTSNPVNTFQVTREGAEIVMSSGRSIEDFFPDELFFLLYDLGHLSTRGSTPTAESIPTIRNLDWATEELSVEDRARVAIRIGETHGFNQLFDGDVAKWVVTLLGKPPVLVEELTRTVADAAGYSYETLEEYSELLGETDVLLLALAAYLQIEWIRTSASFADSPQDVAPRIFGAESEFVYLETSDTDMMDYTVPGDYPLPVFEGLRTELHKAWSPGVGTAGFAALTSIELERRYGVDTGIILPRDRLDEFPVELPSRSALTELYEAFRLLQSQIDHVLSSPKAGVTHGDGSPCDRWYREVKARITGEAEGIVGLGPQQQSRVAHSVSEYRIWYGDGETVTDFELVTVASPTEAQHLRLFGVGIFEHGEQVRVPVAPKSHTPLPVYPRSDAELEAALDLLNEFPVRPDS